MSPTPYTVILSPQGPSRDRRSPDRHQGSSRDRRSPDRHQGSSRDRRSPDRHRGSSRDRRSPDRHRGPFVLQQDAPNILSVVQRILDQTHRPAEIIAIHEEDREIESATAIAAGEGIVWTSILASHSPDNAALNQAVKAARHDIVAFLEPDANPASDCLGHLLDVLQRFGHVGVAAVAAAPAPCVRRDKGSATTGGPRAAIERFFLLEDREYGSLLSSGYCSGFDDRGRDPYGPDSFDADTAPPGVLLAHRAACIENPFPETYEYLAPNSFQMFTLRLTRHNRILLVPQAEVSLVSLGAQASRLQSNSQSKAFSSAFTEGRATATAAYWTHRQFASRGPLSYIKYLHATLGLILLTLTTAIIRLKISRFPESAGLFVGLIQSTLAQIRSRPLSEAAKQAATSAGHPPANAPRGLAGSLLKDPQENDLVNWVSKSLEDET